MPLHRPSIKVVASLLVIGFFYDSSVFQTLYLLDSTRMQLANLWEGYHYFIWKKQRGLYLILRLLN